MIDGTERAFPSTDGDTFANEGLTIKQHMVIEFTKALISSCNWNDTILDENLMEIAASKACKLTDIVIKKLNEDETT